MRLTAFILILFSHQAFGQTGVALIYEEMPDDSVYALSINAHTSIKPEIRIQNTEKGIISFKGKSKQIGIINPLADLNFRYINQSYYRTGAGLSLESTFKNKWYFRTNVIGGVGFGDSSFFSTGYFVKSDSAKYSYADVRGRLSYTPNDIFNFQIGLDNNFIGEGNRSLFLSDYGKPYPFGQIRARFWRVEYTVLYQFYREKIKEQWSLKNGATHYISFNAAKWLNIGIFETVVFQPKDTLLNRGYDVEYLNPVIFYRPQEYSLGSSDNVLLGVSFAAKYKKSLTFYGQLILDEFFLSEIKAKTGWWANKYGGQLGLKGRFQSGKNNFFFRTEYNFVRPYAYAHLNSGQNYGNQGMTLAHPYGANFMEILGEFKIQRGNWSLKSFFSFFLKGYDKDGFSYGGDLYQPYTYRPYDYNHFIGQGLGNDGFRAIVTVSYKVLKQGNLLAFVENQFRYDSAFKRSNYIPMIGLRSQLWNDYRNY
jgi:hypothetical protein